MWPGTRRLLLLNVTNPARSLLGGLTNQASWPCPAARTAAPSALFDDCVDAAVDKLMRDLGGPAWDPAGFDRLYEHVRADLYDDGGRRAGQVEQILSRLARGRRAPRRPRAPGACRPRTSASSSAGLVYPGFVTATGYGRLPDVLRYLRAIERRLEQAARGARGATRSGWTGSTRWRTTTRSCWTGCTRRGAPIADVREIRWMIEELRVSFFAQTLGTPTPVSEKRIGRRWRGSCHDGARSAHGADAPDLSPGLEDGGVELDVDRGGQPERGAERHRLTAPIDAVVDVAVDGDRRGTWRSGRSAGRSACRRSHRAGASLRGPCGRCSSRRLRRP